MKSLKNLAEAFLINVDSNKYSISTNSKILTIHEVLPSDAGFYYCCQKNRGIISFFLSVIMKEKTIKVFDRVVSSDQRKYFQDKHTTITYKNTLLK